MNTAELAALQQPISNDARTLYCIGLRPAADASSGMSDKINYKNLLALLNGTEEKYNLGRQINGLIRELVEVGLISLSEETPINRSFNGKQVAMPLLKLAPDDYAALHMSWHNMSGNWQPDTALFEDLASMVGIVDKAFTADELGEFIAYWMGRPEMQFSPFQWTQKFVFHIRKKRLAAGINVAKKVGNQWVKPKAGLQVDDNARKLVEKYSSNK